MLLVPGFRSILTLIILSLGTFGASSLYAAPNDPAALPDAVVQSLLKAHQQPGNAVPQLLRQHLEEAAELIDEAENEDRLQQTGEANLLESKQQLLEAKRTEIADLRQEVEGQLDQMRTKLAGLKLTDKVKAFDR